jgi:hypothetical protein
MATYPDQYNPAYVSFEFKTATGAAVPTPAAIAVSGLSANLLWFSTEEITEIAITESVKSEMVATVTGNAYGISTDTPQSVEFSINMRSGRQEVFGKIQFLLECIDLLYSCKFSVNTGLFSLDTQGNAGFTSQVLTYSQAIVEVDSLTYRSISKGFGLNAEINPKLRVHKSKSFILPNLPQRP